MTADPAKSKVLQNTALTVLTSVFLIVVGYELNSWLSRDDLSVQYVRFLPTMHLPPPSDEIQRKFSVIKGDSTFQNGMNGTQCIPVLNQHLTDPTESIGAKIQDLRSCIENFTSDNKVEIEILSETAAQLDKNPSPSAIEVVLNHRPYVTGSNLSPEEKLRLARREAKDDVSEAVNAGHVADEIIAYLKDVKPVKTGTLMVLATVVNSGDTDGLLMSVTPHYLILNKNSARLPIKLIGTYPYGYALLHYSNSGAVVSVPKRGATTVAFLLDPSVLPEPPRSAVTALLKDAPPDLKGRIILKDMRDRDLESKEFDFPVGAMD
jgi:hypothetical protein